MLAYRLYARDSMRSNLTCVEALAALDTGGAVIASPTVDVGIFSDIDSTGRYYCLATVDGVTWRRHRMLTEMPIEWAVRMDWYVGTIAEFKEHWE